MGHRYSLGRRAGLLLPLSSVRSADGGLACYTDAGAIARLLKGAGCTLWQLLPLNEVAPGQDSPYAASSSCALEPVYVDLAAVPEHEGDLTAAERAVLESDRRNARVDFGAVRRVKRAALRRAYGRFQQGELKRGGGRAQAFANFCAQHRGWLTDFALYRALHDARLKSWRDWEPGLRDRVPEALAQAQAELRDEVEANRYVQWVADEQWRRGRAEANAAGVKVLGDLPFMVAEDSADVWGLQQLFLFHATVGVPPDAYSAEGQDWGLPVPRWEAMRQAGDPWLGPRADRAAELYDAFRVDHVVGLYRTYVRPLDKSAPYFTPATEPEQRAQGERILNLLGEKADVLAEDLGTVPDFVRQSLRELGIPGTKVLRWENDEGRPRDPLAFSETSLAVTGTHDTETMAEWWEGLSAHERELQLTHPMLAPLGAARDRAAYGPEVRSALLALAYAAGSDALLTPITDALGMRERMNTPGTVGPQNWTWRLPWTLPQLATQPQAVAVWRELLQLAERFGRRR